MDDAERVRLRQRLTCLQYTLDREIDRKGPAPHQHRREIEAGEALHHEVGHATIGQLADVVDAHHVLAADPGDSARLALQTNDVLGEQQSLGGEDLDGDLLIELEVCSPIDDTHPAAAQDRFDSILARDDVAGHRHR